MPDSVTEDSHTTALDVVYAWLGGGRGARQHLLESRYQTLVQRIALALDGQRADYLRVADGLEQSKVDGGAAWDTAAWDAADRIRQVRP